MQITVGDIAKRVGALVDGDALAIISGFAGVDQAKNGDITFCSDPKYYEFLPGSRATAILVTDQYRGQSFSALLRVNDPYGKFVEVLKLFQKHQEKEPSVIHPTSLVDPSVRLGSDVSVGAFSVLEAGAVLGDRVTLGPGVYVGRNSVIGEGSFVHPNVTIREGVSLGRRVIVHSGSVLGSDGFGYLSHEDEHEKVPHVGGVVIGDDVEIGANVTIDRGTLGETRIERGVKIDNLVHIGHNVQIGEDTLIVAQVGISGSTQIGKKAILAGQAGIAGHITIGEAVQVGAQAGVTKSIPGGTRVSGYPAMEHDRARRLNAYYRKLPGFFDQLKRLEQRIQELEQDGENIS